MEVILLENIRNLGPFGTKVNVAPGFARNFLIPSHRAVPANRANVARFEADRAELEAKANARLEAAQLRAAKMQGLKITISARAAEEGKLYGSVSSNDVADRLNEQLEASGLSVSRQEVRLPKGAIREIGEYSVELQLHTEVTTAITVVILAA
jgi:large subunit ribosomal protein L9